MAVPLLALLGCPTVPVLVRTGGGDGSPGAGDTAEVPEVGTFAADTGVSADGNDACDALPDGPVPVSGFDHYTGADFDFDALGRLVSIDGDVLLAWDGEGDAEVVVRDVGPDARGLQVDHDGAVLVASHGSGTVVRYNLATGASVPRIGGLVGPTGLEIGDPRVLYVAESEAGRVFEFDTPRMVAAPIASVPYPNHLALSPSHDVLYVSDLLEPVIWALDRRSTDAANQDWGEPRIAVATPESMGAIEVDDCGNLYGVGASGDVYRFDLGSGGVVHLASLGVSGYGAFVAARWGNDRGPWRRDVLYVSDHFRVWAVEAGVRGRDQPVDEAPGQTTRLR